VTGGHDAGVFRLNGPASVRLRPGVPDIGQITVVADNDGDHADVIGVYLAFVPPGGSSNPGGCSPSSVSNLGASVIQPRDKVTLNPDDSWQCAVPASVDGLSWTLHAIADVHANDFASCATIQQVLGGACSAALADDDDRADDNSGIRVRPRVVALNP
jgi:hypothetical protein